MAKGITALRSSLELCLSRVGKRHLFKRGFKAHEAGLVNFALAIFGKVGSSRMGSRDLKQSTTLKGFLEPMP
ncbi:hypothetical protein KY290_027530 [Solanum tuberosum]|uniref:Transposase n=1 Tax=Solanum tuberosum TaxID=4113 RepID=A0ABQ7UH44_SOLTU|nr:hypothetical protein KY285_026467 [Solanum tuberosum]KAH0748298.1 hypothetical protein KY290_027530 [Solanum tuberosum]